jgi:pimeloyl-ACP methyl ester carboxylesterase
MVGHSLGGFESMLFADKYLTKVVGMVLVDPSIPDQLTRFRRAAPAFAALIETSNAKRPVLLRKCADWVRRGGVHSGAPDPGGCLSFPDDYPPALAKSLAALDLDAARWAANISLSVQFPADTRLVVNPRRNYKDMPLVVLTSSKLPSFDASTPQAVVRDAPLLLAELMVAHDEIAGLSTRGVNREVPDSGHYIQIEHPEAVLTAVEEVASQSSLTDATPR